MRNLILLLPMIMSCSLTTLKENAKQTAIKREASRKVSSLREVRIVEVSENNNVHDYTKSKLVDYKFRVFKYALIPYQNKEIEVAVKTGSGELIEKSYRTDDDGFVSFSYKLPQEKEDTHIEIYAEDVKKDILFTVTRPAKYVGDFSLEKSSFSVDRKNFEATGKDFAKFRFVARNELGNKVEAFALKLVVSGESIMQDMREVELGVYEAEINLGKKSGKQEFRLIMQKEQKSETVHVNLKPVLDLTQTKLSFKKEGTIYKVYVSLKDHYGDLYRNISHIKVLLSTGEPSNLRFDDIKEEYYFIATPPKRNANIKAGVEIEGKRIWADQQIEHVFHESDKEETIVKNTKYFLKNENHFDTKPSSL